MVKVAQHGRVETADSRLTHKKKKGTQLQNAATDENFHDQLSISQSHVNLVTVHSLDIATGKRVDLLRSPKLPLSKPLHGLRMIVSAVDIWI